MFYRVFLDTNIYDGASYSFHGADFEAFREYALQEKLILVTNAVVDGEVRAHIDENIKGAVQEINTLVKKNRFFAPFRRLPNFKDIIAKQEKQEWVDACLKEYDSLLHDCRVEYIGVEGVDIDKILADYFQQRPPFETKKPNEFKDAIAVASVALDITRVFADSEESMAVGLVQDNMIYCVVSSDKGFRDAIIANCNPMYRKNIRVFEKLKDFIVHTQVMDKQAKFLKAFLLSNYGIDEMREIIQQVIENASIDISIECGAFADEQDITNVDEIEYMPHILGVYAEEGKPQVTKVLLEVSCKVRVWYSYTDEDNSFYDKEDKVYIWKSEVEKEGLYQIEFDIVVSLIVDDCLVPADWAEENLDYDFSGKSIVSNDYIDIPEVIKLSDDNLIDEEVLRHDDPFMEEEVDGERLKERAYTVCPDCGSPINRFNDSGTGYCINCAKKH